jgi:arabinose-5-phosphate isomerase
VIRKWRERTSYAVNVDVSWEGSLALTKPTLRQPAADVLRCEAQALLDAAERLDEAAFEKAVSLIATSPGKAVLTGAGTSGVVAAKVAATLTSTGTPAVFLHPVDALHGGLGAVTSEDVVIAVSNSGETDELRAILPYLRNRQVPLIAIVGNLQSTLALAADVALNAGVDREACPLNIAPTSSATLAVAIGDALAISLYEVNGLTPERFALNHPSGALGRRLTLRVADLMHPGAPAVLPTAGWFDVLAQAGEGGLGATVVVDAGQRLLGIITDGDLRRAMERHAGGVMDVTAEMVMTANPVVVAPDELAYSALQLMEDRPSQISVLPVVDIAARCIGLVRVHDLVRAGL